MTWGWPHLAVLALGSYALKVTGLLALGSRELSARITRLLALLPAALFGALIVISAFGDERSLVFDARTAGLAVAGLAVWRRANFVVVVVAAAAATATVRALS
ncbi:MAG: AzlD domain-containing protein [Actinobacteria bacterium]|nr:AzlD domain-containing protein [Actinomycetota bacterium]